MSCRLILQNFGGTCFSGSTISGHVVCTFQSNKNIRGLKLIVIGREYTSWSESESYTENGESKTRDVTYSGDNKFLEIDIMLLGKTTVAPGRYEYPFTFTLPTNLPASFQGIYGHIKYFIKAIVDVPFGMDYVEIRHFDVISRIDFNPIKSELHLAPVSYQDEKTICCWCCASGPITLDVHLQKKAFVLGEVSRIKIVISNLSNVNIEQINVKLKSVIICKVTSPSMKKKSDTELLSSTSDTGVGAHGERTYDLELQIPTAGVVYNFKRCTLFKQNFTLEVEACIGGCHTNMNVKTNVVLGHIPVNDIQNQSMHETYYSQISTVSPPQIYLSNNFGPSCLPSDQTSPHSTIAPPTAGQGPSGSGSTAFPGQSSSGDGFVFVGSEGPSSDVVQTPSSASRSEWVTFN